jgi:hypothetical protein
MRTTYEHWFLYFMIKNTALIDRSINWAKTEHSIVRLRSLLPPGQNTLRTAGKPDSGTIANFYGQLALKWQFKGQFSTICKVVKKLSLTLILKTRNNWVLYRLLWSLIASISFIWYTAINISVFYSGTVTVLRGHRKPTGLNSFQSSVRDSNPELNSPVSACASHHR